MKNAKKILERKRKIIVVLVVMVSFVSVLAWYQMKKAHAYQSYNTGGNKHFKDGHLTVNINGPNGKSDSLTMYIHSDEYEKNKNDSTVPAASAIANASTDMITFSKSKFPNASFRLIPRENITPYSCFLDARNA